MVRQCQVCGKMSNTYPNLSYHRFPMNLEIRNVWFALVDIDTSRTLPKNPEICSEHFDPLDIIYKENGLRYIRPGATPRLCDPPSSPEPEDAWSQEDEFMKNIPLQNIEDMPSQEDEFMKNIPLQNIEDMPSQEEEFMKNIPLQNIEDMPSTPSSMGVNSFKFVNVDEIKELPRTQPALPQLNTSTMIKLSPPSTDTPSTHGQNPLSPSTGAFRSPLTGLEVKPPPVQPSPVFPIRVKPPAGWKNISDPKFSLTSSPVHLDTLRQDIKEEPPVEPFEPMEQIQTRPMMEQKVRGVLDLDKISEEELVKLIESDSPLLTGEMNFGSKKIGKKRHYYIGDLTEDDFVTPAGRTFFLAAKKRAEIYRTKIRNTRCARNRLQHKLARLNRMLKIVERTCDVSEAKKILEGKENDDKSSESSSSKEDDESDIEGVIMNPMTKIDPVHFANYEKEETRINHFDFSNRVQVKFLPEGDTEMITTLKIEINKLSHADISKSKRIDELNNAIFKKNKIIDDLQRQIDELKAETGQIPKS